MPTEPWLSVGRKPRRSCVMTLLLRVLRARDSLESNPSACMIPARSLHATA